MAELEITGIENLLTEVEKLGQAGSRIENKALKEAGQVVKEAIKAVTPKKTGALKKSIEVSGVKTREGIKQVEVGPGKDGWYGKFVEFGTVKMKAKPFMGPGYEASKNEAMAAVEKELKKGLGL